MPRITIIDAVVRALPRDGIARTAKEIYQILLDKPLFTFRARDPVGVLRSALRRHLASHGGEGQPAARVRMVDRDRYVVV